jgi:hypothetical protein
MFKVRIWLPVISKDKPFSFHRDIELPFPPFIGLVVAVKNPNSLEVGPFEHVMWNEGDRQFVVHVPRHNCYDSREWEVEAEYKGLGWS